MASDTTAGKLVLSDREATMYVVFDFSSDTCHASFARRSLSTARIVAQIGTQGARNT